MTYGAAARGVVAETPPLAVEEEFELTELIHIAERARRLHLGLIGLVENHGGRSASGRGTSTPASAPVV